MDSRLIEALKAADAAGDIEAATKLAQALRGAPKSLKESNPAEYDSSSKEYQALYGPQSDSNFQNARAGFGKAFPDLLRGVKQFAVDTMYPQSNAGDTLRKEQDEVKLRDAPLMRTKAGLAGNIGGNVAAALPTAMIPGVNTYTGAAAIGAGLGALQPVGTDESRAANAAVGAGGGVAGRYLGGKIGDWAGRVGQAVGGSPERAAAIAAAENQVSIAGGGAGSNAALRGSVNVTSRTAPGVATLGEDASAGLTNSQREIMQRGQAIGMRSTPGQASGSRALQQLEAKLESQPMTSGPFNAIKETNSRVLSREAAASIGEDSDTVSSATLDHAFTRIGQVFDDAADDVARPIDPRQFMERFGAVQTELQGVSNGFANNKVIEMLIGHAERGEATGAQLQAITSKLGKAAYKEMTSPQGDRELGQGLYQMKDYVDDLLQSGMSESRARTFQTARQQYRSLMMLTSRVGILNPSTGNVNGISLANLLQQKDKAGFLRGRNRSGLYDAARFAQAFKPIVGDSGTATRSQIQGVTEMAMRIPYNLAAKAYTSPLSVNLASRAGAASRATGNATRNMFGSAPFYAPFVLPGQGGLLARELADQ